MCEPDADWIEGDDDALVRRLRRLEWPKAPAAVRERCWEDLSRRLELARSAPPAPPVPLEERPRRDAGQRYEYSRRERPVRGVAGVQRGAVGRPWGRPARAFSLA